MPNCINYSKEEIVKLNDFNNKIVIQISGGVGEFPEIDAKNKYQFLFEDCDESEEIIDPEFWISDTQAKELANIIKKAKRNNMDIIVHCNKGVSRSGAVVEAAVRQGFIDTGKHREPNMYVLRKIEENLKNKCSFKPK